MKSKAFRVFKDLEKRVDRDFTPDRKYSRKVQEEVDKCYEQIIEHIEHLRFSLHKELPRLEDVWAKYQIPDEEIPHMRKFSTEYIFYHTITKYPNFAEKIDGKYSFLEKLKTFEDRFYKLESGVDHFGTNSDDVYQEIRLFEKEIGQLRHNIFQTSSKLCNEPKRILINILDRTDDYSWKIRKRLMKHKPKKKKLKYLKERKDLQRFVRYRNEDIKKQFRILTNACIYSDDWFEKNCPEDLK